MSNHRITAEIGEEMKVDIDYTYVPGIDGAPAELEVTKATVVGDQTFNELTPVYVRELAQTWLDDEGYEMAKEHAERERHGDWE
jgi:hypothetical protein